MRRHIDLVHSVALRTVQDSHLAKDVIQGVFIAVAKDAARLAKHPTLVGWLHLTARNLAAQAVRSDRRRHAREQEAVAMNTEDKAGAGWEAIGPQLDAVIGELGAADREAVLLRYFERKPAAEIAAILGISTEAAQKRVNRAVERMRGLFAKRGITAAAGGLAGIIAANAVQVAPLGWASGITEHALAAAARSLPAATQGALSIGGVPKLALAAFTVLLAATCLYLSSRDSGALTATVAGPPVSAAPPAKHRAPATAPRPALSAPPGIKRDPTRQAALVSLKRRWLEVNDNAHVNEQDALAKESVERLLCGIEMHDLAAFLEENATYGLVKVNQEFVTLFRSGRGAEARALLAEVSLLPVGGGQDSRLEEWCLISGQNCPREEFAGFLAALQDPRLAQEAALGQSLEVALRDPEAALGTVLEIQRSEVPSLNQINFLGMLFNDKLPEGTDFAKLESMLPIGVPSHNPDDWNPLESGRATLIKIWAGRDPEAACDYVVAHPERCPENLIAEVARAVAENTPAAASSWPARFPPGPRHDLAASAVAYSLRWNELESARELAGKIGDEDLREKVLLEIEKTRQIRDGELTEDD